VSESQPPSADADEGSQAAPDASRARRISRRAILKSVVLGPLVHPGWMRWGMAPAIVAFALLTQIGAVAWPIAGLVAGRPIWLRAMAWSALAYTILSVVIVPFAAQTLGRVQLPCYSEFLVARNPLYCALNRNWVTPELRTTILEISARVASEHPGTVVSYLDGGFPFPGTPLLPHLSHGDGNKLDLAFFHVDRENQPIYQGGCPIGYFGYTQPAAGVEPACPDRWYDLRWDMNALQIWLSPHGLDDARTRTLVEASLEHPAIGKVLLEPHLQRRLNLESDKLRFQGCRAARHDDHVHIQLVSR